LLCKGGETHAMRLYGYGKNADRWPTSPDRSGIPRPLSAGVQRRAGMAMAEMRRPFADNYIGLIINPYI
jgi:hypothetical protein